MAYSLSKINTNNNTEKVYHINYASPGHVIIFNVKHFPKSPHYTRHGSEKDVERLSRLFGDLNYEIEINLDLDSAQMRSRLIDYSIKDYSQDSCCIVFIMSHGNKGTILASDNTNIYLTEFIDPFKTNKSLKNKPKLFFIQACRGNQTLKNMDDIESEAVSYDSFETDSTKVPIEADLLCSYSTIEGYYSYRDPNSGSWYIQTLCDVISNVISNEKYYNILNILTDVNSLMAKREIIMPTFESSLTKRFYFNQNNKQSSKQKQNNNIQSNNEISHGKLYHSDGRLKYDGELLNGKFRL
jgi:hypothetical protein